MSKINYLNRYNLWLWTSLFCVAVMVAVGGATRLTDSGLSITEWYLFDGIFPPLDQASWLVLFEKYQQIPQYKLINFSMNLEEFKAIFWLEYIHRLIGRVTGLIIIIPALFFILKMPDKKKFLIIVMSLLLLQGLMGWVMVASGLTELVSVSHFRLSIHLLLAFILFALLFNELIENKNLKINIEKDKEATLKKYFSIFFPILIIQIIYGAFVAGLDAGLIYNEFPLMGGRVFPEEFKHVSLLNALFYNHATVQFIHRFFAILLFVISLYSLYILTIFKYPKLVKRVILAIFLILIIQISLGILTLLTIVNINIALLHQFVALILFALTFASYNYLKKYS